MTDISLRESTMFEVPAPRSRNPHESKWDSHGSYKWTYFAEEIKQRIRFFLLQRLHGKNIDVGGGWYLSYPDSVVLDLSSVCLRGNPGTKKLQFDLDEVGNGRRLPFMDGSFDSATVVSVWQYLSHPDAVLNELKRVLKPGAEMYLINGQGAGLEECVVGATRTKGVQDFFHQRGYDTLVEHIPDFRGEIGEFQSVCVAMPGEDLFGKAPSRIMDKARKRRMDELVCEEPSTFLNAYIEWEMHEIVSRLAKLSTFPVTARYKEYMERIEAFSQECFEQQGITPLLFVENCFEPEMMMRVADRAGPPYGHLFLLGTKRPVGVHDDTVDPILKKHGLSFGRHCNYFPQSTTEGLLDYFSRFRPVQRVAWRGIEGNEFEVMKFVTFISSLGLNSFTQEMQHQAYDLLRPKVADLDSMIRKERAAGYHLAAYEHKQKRRIDRMIETKDLIESEGVPVVAVKKLDYALLLPEIRRFIR